MKKALKVKIFVSFLVVVLVLPIVLFLQKKIRTDNVREKLLQIKIPPDYRQKNLSNTTKIEVIEFSDFSCPACANMHFYLKDATDYFQKIHLVFKHYPLTDIHPNAFKASLWAECAGKEYGRFWDFADILFKNRQEWSFVKDPVVFFKKYAAELKMNSELLEKCSFSSDAVDIVKNDIREGDELKIDATPTFFVNKKRAVGGYELIETLKKEMK